MTLSQFLDADWRRLLEFCGKTYRPRRFRNLFSPRFASVVIIRISQVLSQSGWGRLAKFFALINFVCFGIEVSSKLSIGPGLVIPHTYGTVIGAGYIGNNVTIFQQVTLGARSADFSDDPMTRPRVADGVIISAGAKILGPVNLGECCVIGANAVVLQDIPPGALAVGVPARIVLRTTSNCEFV
jgi:serine O-acetyltransferase